MCADHDGLLLHVVAIVESTVASETSKLEQNTDDRQWIARRLLPAETTSIVAVVLYSEADPASVSSVSWSDGLTDKEIPTQELCCVF